MRVIKTNGKLGDYHGRRLQFVLHPLLPLQLYDCVYNFPGQSQHAQYLSAFLYCLISPRNTQDTERERGGRERKGIEKKREKE